MENITGILTNIRFARDGFLIAQLADGATVLGNLSTPIIGQAYDLSGQWIDNQKFGKQFKFDYYRVILPQDITGIRRYITRAKWVGPEIARKIVDLFGEDTLTILKNEPERVAQAISGITLSRANEISQTLKQQEEMESITIELESLLGDQHLPKYTIPTLIERFRSDAAAQLKKNPYLLCTIRGIGFLTADRVAMAMGHERESIERRMAASLYALRDAADSQGHTWLSAEKFIERVQSLIGLPPGSDAVAALLQDKGVREENGMIALADLAQNETDLAGMVRHLLAGADDLSGAEHIDLKGLAPDQMEAFKLCMAHPIFILTGAPGTGKTYLIRRIIEQFKEWRYRIALAAPTGKAAKRMNEMIDMPASTIHRLLGPEPCEVNGETKFSFRYGEDNPLPEDLVVIDEFSMVDISLATSLFRDITPGTRVLIVGDHYQLPSVGPGDVLRDLLAAGMPSYELTQIKRNTGDIVKACHAIKDGQPAIPSPILDPDQGYNLRHIEESDPIRIQEIIRDLVANRLPKRGYDPVWDVQVLSPMNERTQLSCLHLNGILQEALNIHPPVKGTPFRVADKVLQRKNESIDDEFVVNGDLGSIEKITDSEYIVMFKYPDRRVRVKRKEHHLSLAYCMTVHKLQGSESPAIIFPVHSCFGPFFNRELLYTGISRGKDIVITVGEWGALHQAIGRVGNVRRITRLTELLKV